MDDQRRMKAQPFHFKKFSMMHHQSTMKIGTDAIMLGAWVDLHGVKSALDVGTGSGIIAMIMAQRGVQNIEAIELDEISVMEARTNFEVSQWRNRFTLHHVDARHFREECDNFFDLVISNPPFFYDSFQGNQARRNLARHAGYLEFNDLLQIGSSCLKTGGSLAVVIPSIAFERFMKDAKDNGFFLYQKLNIIPVEGRIPNRLNLLLKKAPPKQIDESFFTIRNQDGSFTSEYYELLKDFYLGF
jgi:tRNA1Val (adenine37-N6)-methyltransferase